jgi:hypothetical protein
MEDARGHPVTDEAHIDFVCHGGSFTGGMPSLLAFSAAFKQDNVFLTSMHYPVHTENLSGGQLKSFTREVKFAA